MTKNYVFENDRDDDQESYESYVERLYITTNFFSFLRWECLQAASLIDHALADRDWTET